MLSIKIEGLEKLNKRLNNIANSLNNAIEINKKIVPEMQDNFREVFLSQQNSKGKKWKKSKRVLKLGFGFTLINTTNLIRSLTVTRHVEQILKITKKSVTLGTNTFYAKYNNPSREFIYLKPKVAKKIKNIYSEEIKSLLRR